jgi:cyclopropane fatty-acyl-phospholipid synthase-like methyltransferase
MSQYWENHWNAKAGAADEQSQVERTRDKRPIDAAVFQRTVDYVADEMRLDHNAGLLELCCGNGLFTIQLARRIRSVTAVDFSKPLLAALKKKIAAENIPNIEVEHKDVARYDVKSGQKYSHVLLYSALQYFSEPETIRLFEMARAALADAKGGAGGIFYIGDIPDRARLWHFANTPEYRRMYFDSVKNQRSAIGTWFLKEDLLHLAEYAGFHKAEIVEQPEWQINSRFRFDMRLEVL